MSSIGATVPSLTGLYLYPVKSAAGYAVDEAAVGPEGLAGDRRFVVTGPDGRFLTARTRPRLLDVAPRWRDDGTLAVSAPGMPVLDVDPADAGAPRAATIWQDHFTGLDCGGGAAEWFSSWLGEPVRLVHLPEPSPRQNAGKPPWGGSRLGAADGAPLLVTSLATLAELGSRLDEPVPMARFRPNLVLDGAPPSAEDRWRALRQGEVVIELLWRCTRCKLITIDAEGRAHPRGEPLRTLLAYRTDEDGRPVFGRNARARVHGTLRAGCVVAVD